MEIKRAASSCEVEHRVYADGRLVERRPMRDFSWAQTAADLESGGHYVVVERGVRRPKTVYQTQFVTQK